MNTKASSPDGDMAPVVAFKRGMISRTMLKLCMKYDCNTVDEYREIRRKNRHNKPKKQRVDKAPSKPTPQKGGNHAKAKK